LFKVFFDQIRHLFRHWIRKSAHQDPPGKTWLIRNPVLYLDKDGLQQLTNVEGEKYILTK
jgi:hypothetical protein